MRTFLAPFVVAMAGACAHAAAPAGDDRPLAVGHTAPAREGGATSEAGPAPFEVAVSDQMLCARIGGRVHCTADLAPDAVIAHAPLLAGIEDATSLTLGSEFGCAVVKDGRVLCWGRNTNGQLGAGLADDRHADPVAVKGVTRAKRVSAGYQHACAVLEDGNVTCWGRNDEGESGSETSYTPEARELVAAAVVPGVSDVVDIAAGRSTTCATTKRGEVVCWGAPQLGEHAPQGKMFTAAGLRPAVLAALDGTVGISGGDGAFCGLRRTEVECWGTSRSFFAKRRFDAKDKPMGPDGTALPHATRVRLGWRHACALLEGGAITCWGSAGAALGRGASLGYEPLPPEIVKGLPPMTDLAVGGQMSCGVSASRELHCWGSFVLHPTNTAMKSGMPVKMRLND